MYKIEYSNDATKMLDRMPKNIAKTIRGKIVEMAVNPRSARNVTQLVGVKTPTFRLRVGDWRVIFLLEEDRLIVHVTKIAPRGGAYQ